MFRLNIKNILYFLCFIFLSNNTFAEGTIATIDLNKILNESNSGKKVLLDLEKLNKKNISLIKDKEKELKKFEGEIETQKKILSKEDLNLKLSEYKKLINEYKLFNDKLTKEFRLKKTTEIKNFFKKINPVVEKYMKENNIGILIDKKNIYISSINNDITNFILKILK